MEDKRYLLDITFGQTIRLPVDFIKGRSSASAAIVRSIADVLQNVQRNIIPLIVRVVAEDEYEAVMNVQILDGDREAKKEFIWCVVVDDEIEKQVAIELGHIEAVRVSLSTASEAEIAATLEHLQSEQAGFSRIKPQKAAKAIVEYRENNDLSDLSFVTKLKCGIGKANGSIAFSTASSSDRPDHNSTSAAIAVNKFCDRPSTFSTSNQSRSPMSNFHALGSRLTRAIVTSPIVTDLPTEINSYFSMLSNKTLRSSDAIAVSLP